MDCLMPVPSSGAFRMDSKQKVSFAVSKFRGKFIFMFYAKCKSNTARKRVCSLLVFFLLFVDFPLQIWAKCFKSGPQRLRFMLNIVCLNWNITKSKRVAFSYQTFLGEKKSWHEIFVNHTCILRKMLSRWLIRWQRSWCACRLRTGW